MKQEDATAKPRKDKGLIRCYSAVRIGYIQ